MRLSNFWATPIDDAHAALAQPTLDAPALAAQLKASLDGAAARASENGFSPEDVQLALFAVVAWIDEQAMSRQWPGAEAWRLAPLQRHYFATTRAGAAFFEKLEALGDEAIEVREMYGLVLLAGFQGRYANRPPGELASYRRALLERIAQQREMAPFSQELPLFPQSGVLARSPASHGRGLAPSLASVLLVVVPLCALLALYLFLDFRLAQTAQRLIAPLMNHL